MPVEVVVVGIPMMKLAYATGTVDRQSKPVSISPVHKVPTPSKEVKRKHI
jgi:hypothetical protein